MSNASPNLVLTIQKRLQSLQLQMAKPCSSINKNTSDVHILAVSKNHTAQAVQAAYEVGLRDFGENYVQEGLTKMTELQALLPEHGAHWHFIGPIQSNKTRAIAQHFDWVHSVDRFKIAQRLSEQRPQSSSTLNICLQINISGEVSKSGCLPNEALPLALNVMQLAHIKLRGLMIIPAPIASHANTTEQQAPFKAASDLFQHIKNALPSDRQNDFDTLSMGMSDDFTHAIAQGATMIRIGAALFGSRD